MNDIAAREPFDDVTDSTDWLATPLSGLAAVEAALRCQVCKDFYKTPMLTSCNHTFCSICIRRALSNDGKCPLCRTSEQELKLRSNWSVEEVVTTFTKTRPDVLQFAKRDLDVGVESTKRKLADTEDTEDTDLAGQHLGKRLRSSTRLSKSRSMEATSEMARLEADVPSQEDPTDFEPFEPDDGLVACPICWQRMKPLLVDRHLDTSCPGEPQSQPRTPLKQASRSISIPNVLSTSSAFSPKKRPTKMPERLPAINYSMLKEPQLRKKMAELGLSATGNRQMLERRHKEWMTIWNANCDALHPRRRAELLHDLDVWERTLGSKAPTSSKALSLGAQIKDKDFDGVAWAAKHDTSFKNLVASARQNRARAQQKAGGGEDVGKRREGEAEPPAQANTEMLASWEDSSGNLQRPVATVAQAAGIIDLTGEVAESHTSGAELLDGEGRRADGGRAHVDNSPQERQQYRE
ncbi:DNA repair protein rad18 [Hypoxylon fuscum]|nr:DNA repair protein rad18 [Hypoxylon fuscum]